MSRIVTSSGIEFKTKGGDRGTVIISSKRADFEATEMSFDDFIVLASNLVRERKIREINLMSDREILGLKP